MTGLHRAVDYSSAANCFLRPNHHPIQTRTLRAATRKLDRLHEHAATIFLPWRIKRHSRTAVPMSLLYDLRSSSHRSSSLRQCMVGGPLIGLSLVLREQLPSGLRAASARDFEHPAVGLRCTNGAEVLDWSRSCSGWQITEIAHGRLVDGTFRSLRPAARCGSSCAVSRCVARITPMRCTWTRQPTNSAASGAASLLLRSLAAAALLVHLFAVRGPDLANVGIRLALAQVLVAPPWPARGSLCRCDPGPCPPALPDRAARGARHRSSGSARRASPGWLPSRGSACSGSGTPSGT